MLDQVNDRLARYPAGGSAPRYTRIAFAGGEGDLAVGADGTTFVLDQGAEPVVRSYSPSGAVAATTAVDGTGADMLRSGPAGTLLHGYPGDMWKPIGGGVGALLAARATGRRRPTRTSGGRRRRGGRTRRSKRGVLRARPRRPRPSSLACVERLDPRRDSARGALRRRNARRAPRVDADEGGVRRPRSLAERARPAPLPSTPHSGPSPLRSAGSASRARRSTSCARPRPEPRS